MSEPFDTERSLEAPACVIQRENLPHFLTQQRQTAISISGEPIPWHSWFFLWIEVGKNIQSDITD